MKIIIACDHAAVERQDEIIKYLTENAVEVETVELNHYDTDDYPDFAFALCKKVVDEDVNGILLYGNGIGMSIAANKVKGIRCARVTNVDDAFKCKNHNGANVIALGANLELEETKNIIDTFIVTKPASEERHLRRINKIIQFESGE